MITESEKVILRASKAFSVDSYYLEMMVYNAGRIRIRAIKDKIRKELRQAEHQARKKCIASDVRVCYNYAPCGTGACPFAQGDLKLIKTCKPGYTKRPERLAKISVGSSAFFIDNQSKVYCNVTGPVSVKLVWFRNGSWKMYREASVTFMLDSPKYQEMIDAGDLVTADDCPSHEFDFTVNDTLYDINEAIEPLVKLRAAV